jgi:hypothetical protein
VYVRYYGEDEKKRFVGDMTDERAIKLASSMVTETVIYSVRHPNTHRSACATGPEATAAAPCPASCLARSPFEAGTCATSCREV